MPFYICPKCKERSLDIDAREGFSGQAPACRHCGSGFLFELLDDYYPAPDTGLLVTDQDRRVLAIGRGIYELTGFPEADLMGRDVVDALHLSDAKPVELAREWGVRGWREALDPHACRQRESASPMSFLRTTTTAACSSRSPRSAGRTAALNVRCRCRSRAGRDRTTTEHAARSLAR